MKTLKQQVELQPRCSVILIMNAALLIAGFAESQWAFGQVSSAGDASHFRYDGSASLGVNAVSSKTEAGVTVENITFREARLVVTEQEPSAYSSQCSKRPR